jgi:hypothetical protein
MTTTIETSSLNNPGIKSEPIQSHEADPSDRAVCGRSLAGIVGSNTTGQWRTQKFFFGGGVQQIQLRTDGIESPTERGVSV